MSEEMNDELIEMPVEENSMMGIEKHKSIGEVQAALVIAKRFPRDENESYKKMMRSCERIGLAEKAIYKYTKGTEIQGATIRLAEMMAQNYGNLVYGIKELYRGDGKSIVQSYCWDLENNTRREVQFEINHVVDLKNDGKKTLTSDRDIYEHIANYGSRRLRACILGIIPKDFQDDAVYKCRQTVARFVAGDKDEPLPDKVRKLTSAFGKAGVSIEMLEKYLGHELETCSVEDFVDLMTIFNAIKDKLATRSDFFDVAEEKSSDVKSVIERLNAIKNAPPVEIDGEAKEKDELN